MYSVCKVVYKIVHYIAFAPPASSFNIAFTWNWKFRRRSSKASALRKLKKWSAYLGGYGQYVDGIVRNSWRWARSRLRLGLRLRRQLLLRPLLHVHYLNCPPDEITKIYAQLPTNGAKISLIDARYHPRWYRYVHLINCYCRKRYRDWLLHFAFCKVRMNMYEGGQIST